MLVKFERWIKKITSLNLAGSTAERQAGFTRFFILLGILFITLTTLTDFSSLAFLQSSDAVEHLVAYAFALVIGVVLWQIIRKGYSKLAGYGLLAAWMVGITFLLNPGHPDQILALYCIPTASAAFVLSAGISLVFGALSIVTYSIFYAITGAQVSYNFYFVISIVIFAVASWVIARRIEQIVAETHQSNQKYLDLLEHDPTFTYIIQGDSPGKVVYASPMIKALLGYTPEEWIADTDLWKKRIYPDDQNWVLEEWYKARSEGSLFHAEYRLLSQDGRVVWVSDDAITIRKPGEPLRLQGIMLDITTRKRFEAVQAVIYKISQAANSARTLDGLFNEIHKGLGTLMHAENFFISLYDPATGNIQFPYFVDQFDMQPQPRPLGHGLTEYVLRTGQSLFANPTRFADMVVSGEAESMGAPSLDWLGVPLKIMDRTIGVMAVQSYTEGIRFNEQDLEILTFVSTQAAMAIERKQTDEALRFSEQLYHTTIDSLSELIHVVDRGGRLLMQNQSLRNRNLRLGLPVDLIGKTLPKAFPFLGASILDIYQPVFESGSIVSFVSERTISGEQFIYDIDIVPIVEGGRVERSITVLHDITDQKLAEQRLKDALTEKEVLLREIHHRVKNNLQVITSLLGLQADYIEDPHTLAVFQETQARMRSMALIHEELYQSLDLAHINYSEYIQKLTSNLFQAFSLNPNIHLELDLADVYLGIETAIPCGLIINELVTNALKYAFPNDRSGAISLSLKCSETSGSLGYTLVVQDNGVGIPGSIDFKNTQSLGLQLVNILVTQIKGRIELDTTHGSCFVIEFRDKPA